LCDFSLDTGLLFYRLTSFHNISQQAFHDFSSVSGKLSTLCTKQITTFPPAFVALGCFTQEDMEKTFIAIRQKHFSSEESCGIIIENRHVNLHFTA